MRKCGDCGYLLFGDGDTCNHCGSPVAAVEARVGATATGSSPDPAALAVPRVWQGPSFSPPAPVPPATSQPAPEIWRPIVTAAPPSSSVRTFPTGILLAVVGVLILGAVGFTFVGNRNSLPAGTRDFVTGNGVSFTAPDRSYTAQFPAAPEIQHAPVTVGSVTAQVTLATVSTDSYELGSASFDVGIAIPPDVVDSLLDGALQGGLTRAGGELVAKDQITRGGLPAIDAKFKTPDGYSARFLVVMKNSRIYVLFAHAKSGTDKLFDAFDKSFVPTGV